MYQILLEIDLLLWAFDSATAQDHPNDYNNAVVVFVTTTSN